MSCDDMTAAEAQDRIQRLEMALDAAISFPEEERTYAGKDILSAYDDVLSDLRQAREGK